MSPKLMNGQSELNSLITRTGFVLWTLRDNLRQLGIDQPIAEIAGSIPEVHNRLGHIVTLTSQASNDALNSVEMAQPLQDIISDGAKKLGVSWDDWIKNNSNSKDAFSIALETQSWLGALPSMTSSTQQHLQKIMMAQGLLDLSGQILQRMMVVLSQVESNLLGVLMDAIPEQEIGNVSRKESPASDHKQVADQKDVDDLLASLGL